MRCSICDCDRLTHLKTFSELARGETDLGVAAYYRELWNCDSCGHYMNKHDIDLEKIYDGQYWRQTYKSGTAERFREIMDLPHDQSDNRRRVDYIESFWKEHRVQLKKRVLDIGSGLGVFGAAMKESDWYVATVDPDRRAIEQVIELGGIDAGFVGAFPKVSIDDEYSLVTFIKVLEHVRDPIEILSHAADYVSANGWMYVELPDGQCAFGDSPNRQEFFLEHYSAFSAVSMILLIEKAGFALQKFERLIEPSGKYTLRALASKAPVTRRLQDVLK